MRLYIEKAKELIGQRVDCYKRMFGNYPLIIKQREDGTIYTKDTCGVCCDVPERENDFNCYHYDFIVSSKIDDVIDRIPPHTKLTQQAPGHAVDAQGLVAIAISLRDGITDELDQRQGTRSLESIPENGNG